MTVNFENTSIKQILNQIEDQSEYRFFYSGDVNVERKTSISQKEKVVTEVLDKLFTGTDIKYRLLGRQIALFVGEPENSVASAVPQKTVSGKVTDATGSPLPGVSIVIKGTTQGIITDFDGAYRFSNVPSGTTLIFSFVGMKPQEITVKEKDVINVQMVEETIGIEEVVAVGYGTQKKATLTGSVVSVKGEEIMTTKNTNIQNMLTGKVPGVRVIQKTSEPGVFTNQFDIRGLGSPLLVVDGVPRGDLPRMDPNDIESVSVLKDASAAVYGVRAANGVILVTTKKGERGKAKIEYSMYYGIQTPAEILDPIGARDRAILFNEITMRSTDNPTLTYNEAYFEELAKGERPDTDWYGLVMRKTAPQQQHNISISGGSEKIDYYVNFGYADQGSFFRTNSANYNRYNLRTNFNAQITKNLKAGINLNMIMDETNRQNIASQQIFATLWRSRPDDPLFANNTEGYYYHPDDVPNVVAFIHPELAGFAQDKKNIFQSNMTLEYKVPFVKGLSLKGMFSYDRTFNDNSNFNRLFNEYRYNASNNTYLPYSRTNTDATITTLRRSYSTGFTSLWHVSLNYDRTFAENHHVSGSFYHEESYGQGYDFNAQREFEIPIPYLFAGNSEKQIGNGSGLSESANKAYIGKFNYEYKGKYLFEYAFRYDGSSKFPSTKQWGFFPSYFLGWRVSEESFMRNNLPYINNLKIRFSYGKMGDDGAANFQFVEGFDYPASGSNITLPNGYVFGNKYTNAFGFRNAPNPNITWYTATMKNLGLDADFWNGLLGFSGDMFQRDRDGLLDTPSVVVPGTFGAGISQANLNGDRTKGFEIELRHRYKINNFSYNVSGFVSMTRSMLTKKVQPNRSNSYDYWKNNQVGRYNDIWFGKSADHQYTSYEEIANSIYAGAGTLPGDYLYEDWNGDGVIDDRDDHPIATTTNPNENYSGQRNYPLMNFGFTIGAAYRGFDLNVLMQGAAMSYVSYGGQLLEPLAWNGNALGLLFNRWHPVDPNKDPYDPSSEWLPGYYGYGKSRPDTRSEFAFQKGDYLRLKSIELGYTVPSQKLFLKRLGVQHFRVFVNAYNLLTFSNVRGVDPEKPAEMDGYLYPLNKTFNFGGSITF